MSLYPVKAYCPNLSFPIRSVLAWRPDPGRTPISQKVSTAAAHPGMLTALRSVGLLDARSISSAGPSVALAGKPPDAPCFHARLRRLATKSREKCG